LQIIDSNKYNLAVSLKWMWKLTGNRLNKYIYKKIDNYQRKFLVTGTTAVGIGGLYVYTHDKDCMYN
jgi:hypothetical protein